MEYFSPGNESADLKSESVPEGQANIEAYSLLAQAATPQARSIAPYAKTIASCAEAIATTAEALAPRPEAEAADAADGKPHAEEGTKNADLQAPRDNTSKQDTALSLPHLKVIHQISSEEEDALKSGTRSLATALESEARKAASDPEYLDKNYGHIAAAVHVPINDGSGDNLYLRGILYAVKIKKDGNDSALTFDEFRKQQVEPAAEDSLRSMRFTGKLFDSANLKLSDDSNGFREVSSQINDVEVFRMSKNGDIPQSLAESIAADTSPLVIHQPSKDRWLKALHNDAIRLSQTSPQFQTALKEKLASFEAKGIVPKTDILAGSVIDIKVLDSNGRQSAEIIASPDKPTVYNEFPTAKR